MVRGIVHFRQKPVHERVRLLSPLQESVVSTVINGTERMLIGEIIMIGSKSDCSDPRTARLPNMAS